MGGHYSARQLLGTSEVAKSSDATIIRPLWVVGLTPVIMGNDVAVAGTEVWVMMNPKSYING
jgi:hypothetical protein